MKEQIKIDKNEYDRLAKSGYSDIGTFIKYYVVTCGCGNIFSSRNKECKCHQCGRANGELKFLSIPGYYKELDVRQTECLICGKQISSVYLSSEIVNDKAYQLACMVMHYRHEHVKYYDNSVDYVTQYTNVSYENFKNTVNERAKRQIIRKCKDKLRAIGITSEHFLMLETQDPKTIALAAKYLD